MTAPMEEYIAENGEPHCLYCFKKLIWFDVAWRCENENCGLYMKAQFEGETHD
jgi:hypothetical protein